MDTQSLEIFCAVARHGSVTRAAQELQRAQSNVTTRIRQLEQALDAELFLRSGKRMTLTEAGTTLLAYAQRLLTLAAEARQALHPQTPSGPLRLGTMESTAASRLPLPLARFHQHWPAVQLRLSTGSSGALLDDLEAARLDAVLVALLPDLQDWRSGRPLPRPRGLPAEWHERLSGTPIYEERLLLVLPPGHPLPQHPQSLQLHTVAAFDARCSYRTLIEHWLTHGPNALPHPPRILELNSYHAMLAAVASGSCMAIVPASVLALQPQPQPALPQLELGTVQTWLLQRRDTRSAALDALREHLQQEAPPPPSTTRR